MGPLPGHQWGLFHGHGHALPLDAAIEIDVVVR
jgi:hypothetical protein